MVHGISIQRCQTRAIRYVFLFLVHDRPRGGASSLLESIMRRIIPLSVLAIGAVMACSEPETVIPTAAIPAAGVRFINAVPDTGAAFGLDMRFVDFVESNAQFRIPF